MKALTKVTFVLDSFAIPSPGQQLLDRFLVGYNLDGTFHSPGARVELITRDAQAKEIQARVKEHGLGIQTQPNEAVRNTECAVVAAPFETVREVLRQLPAGARCFIHGPLADSAFRANELQEIAQGRKIRWLARASVQHAFQLPPIQAQEGASRAAVITQGPMLQTEIEGLEAAWSMATPGKEIPKVEFLQGDKVWELAYSREWRKLFESAFSRSNTIQGDPIRDGRTQDVVGLRLVEKLVRNPRAWIVTQTGGPQIAIFVMNGALEDLNVAFETRSGKIASTQFYRPPPPMQDHYSGLAGAIEDFFRQDNPPRELNSMTLLPTVMGEMRKRSQEA